MPLTLICSLPLGLPKRIWPSGRTWLPPPLLRSLTPLPKQVAKVQATLLILLVVDPTWISLEPNLPLIHPLHLPIRLLHEFDQKMRVMT